ncbi:uncharacterized protein PAE49_023663 [Odontesthes bonariensis]|uniref:uncharacterized protein LOC142370692 n=1 Tax=Odontesthes bonariensis TaxID=219752 RepID=UPI003F583B6A
MKQLFWLSLLLIHLPGTESKDEEQSCLSQPNKVIWHETGQSALLPCNISSRCKAEKQQWFAFKDDNILRLSLAGRYSLLGASLQIQSLNVNDSGIYYCAVESTNCCQEYVALGTTLVVREKVQLMVRHILLWSSFTLLAIYSLAIVTLIILKKYGYNVSVSAETSKSDKLSFKKKTQFRNVLQELHSRRNLSKAKQIRRGNSSQVEASSGQCNISTDDIYQNI